MGAVELLARLAEHGQTVAVAESLTGGRLAATIVDVPGASASFLGGVVAYDTALKVSLLSVDPALLAREGAVHAEVALQMARGVRAACAVDGRPTDLGIATTGVAGPTEQDGRAVGTVFVSAATGATEGVRELHLAGGRAEIRAAAVSAALSLAEELLDGA